MSIFTINSSEKAAFKLIYNTGYIVTCTYLYMVITLYIYIFSIHVDGAELNKLLGLKSTGETEKERMIRLGQMTPFGTVITSSADKDSKSVRKAE